MAVAFRVDDGNQATLLEVATEYRFPFSDKGDFDSFEVIKTFRQDKDSYARAPGMTTISVSALSYGIVGGTAYLVEQGEVKDIGDHRFEFTRTYASVPKTRSEGATISFTNQWWRAAVGPPPEGKYFYTVDYDIEEQQFTRAGIYVYEYFITQPAPLLKFRVYLLFGLIQYVGGTGAYPASGTLVIAEDSEVGIHKGGIFYRKTPYVNRL